MTISIICVYNDIAILEKYLLKSLKNQSIRYELILLDNTSGKYNSAAAALNFSGFRANGKYLMFVHQDFKLGSNTWLEEAENILSNLEKFGVAGVAGKSTRKCISNIKENIPPVLAGSIQITKSKEVQTIDECLIIVPKNLFNKTQFDKFTCDNWHLYASDYCLTVKKLGYKIYVLPLDGYHASPGSSFSSKTYYPTLKKIVKKHKKDYKWIYTTTGSWNTIIPISLQIFYQKTYYRLLE